MLMAKVLSRIHGRIRLQPIAEVLPSTLTPIEEQKLLATWKAITSETQEGLIHSLQHPKNIARELPKLVVKTK